MKIRPGTFRLILASVVVLHHNTPLRFGAWAVGLFFCLSGFWIAEMWGRKYSRLDRPYVEFLISRWWRLAPVLFVTTLIAAISFALNLIAGDNQPLHSWLWLITQPAIVGSTVAGRLLPPSWSLDVEMQFYLIAPILIAIMTRLSRQANVIVIILSIIWCYITTSAGRAGESPRIDIWVGVFLVGIAASVGRWKWRPSIVAMSLALTLIIMALAAVIPVSRPWIMRRGAAGPPPTGWIPAALTVGTIALSLPFTLSMTAIPSGRVDRFLGDLSYPLYLFHWLPRQWYYSHLGNDPRPVVAAALLATNLLASLIGAILLLIVIDRPAQRMRARWVLQHSTRHKPSVGTVDVQADEAFAGTY